MGPKSAAPKGTGQHHILWGSIEAEAFSNQGSSSDSRGQTDSLQRRRAQVLFAQSDSAGTPSDVSCPTSSSESWNEQRTPATSGGPIIPLDENGNPTSLGSIHHATGKCTPCDFVPRSAGCKKGVACEYCHFPDHVPSKRTNKARPCKGKRDRRSRFWDRLQSKMEEDPEGFDLDNMAFPPNIQGDEKLTARLTAKMELQKAELLAGRGRASANADDSDASSSASRQVLAGRHFVTVNADATDGTSSASVSEAAQPSSTDPGPKPRERRLISL